MLKNLLLVSLSFAAVLPAFNAVRADSDEYEYFSRSRLTTRAFVAAMMKDRDNDGMPDPVEQRLGTSPRKTDTDRNGLWDGSEDINLNGIYDYKDLLSGKFDRPDFSFKKALKKLPVCKGAKQRGCRKPLCTKKIKKNCIKKPKVMPTPVPSAAPTQVPQNTPAPSATPTPGTNPTAVPTIAPTATPAGSFDGSGNTTAFGIPAGVTGNISRGSTVWTADCSGCHGSMGAKTYSEVNSAMDLGAMSWITLTTQQKADVTAYLNRNSP